MTVTALSVDRLLALLLGLRYRQSVTLKRSYAIITIHWAGATVAGTIYTLFDHFDLLVFYHFLYST